jgi:hypothetical protein
VRDADSDAWIFCETTAGGAYDAGYLMKNNDRQWAMFVDGASGDRFCLRDSTRGADCFEVTSAGHVIVVDGDLYVNASGHGIYMDNNTSGRVLVANGTKFVSSTLDLADISDYGYVLNFVSLEGDLWPWGSTGKVFGTTVYEDCHLGYIRMAYMVSTTNNTTHYWNIYLRKINSSNTETTIASTNTSGKSPNTWYLWEVDVNVDISQDVSNEWMLVVIMTKNNQPGDPYLPGVSLWVTPN